MQGRDAAIFGLAKLAEARDNETGRHLERMCHYAELLAANLARLRRDLDEEGVQVIRSTAAVTAFLGEESEFRRVAARLQEDAGA